jgi:hypothetical protein
METTVSPESVDFQMFMDWLKINCVTEHGNIDFKAMFGPKYVKIVAMTTGSPIGGGSAFCFLDRSNGDVLKSASWRAPAKTARGNIHAGPSGYGLTRYGAAYLR